jgi:threonine/homoserine/homoserine lactone efflux protein
MNPHNAVLAYGLIAFGAIYIAKPDIFYVWMAKRDVKGQRRELPEQSKFFMRGLGMVLLLAGIFMLWRSNSW